MSASKRKSNSLNNPVGKLQSPKLKRGVWRMDNQVGGSWTELNDFSSSREVGDLTSSCGCWSVSIEDHTIDEYDSDDDASESE